MDNCRMEDFSSSCQKIKYSIECWLFSKTQERFLLLKCPETERHREYWQPVTGGIEGNESKPSACIREVLEETGIEINSSDIIKLIDDFTAHSETTELHKTIFVTITENPVVTISDEHIGFMWEIPEMVEQKLLWDSNKATFEVVMSYLKLDK